MIFISPHKERVKPTVEYYEKATLIIQSSKENNTQNEEKVNEDVKILKAPSSGKATRQDLKSIPERDSRFSVNKNDFKIDTKKAQRSVFKSSEATITKDLSKS